MPRPDIEYMLANGYETHESALVSMIETVEAAKTALAEKETAIEALTVQNTEYQNQILNLQVEIEDKSRAFDELTRTHEENNSGLKTLLEQAEADLKTMRDREIEIRAELESLSTRNFELETLLAPATITPPPPADDLPEDGSTEVESLFNDGEVYPDASTARETPEAKASEDDSEV